MKALILVGGYGTRLRPLTFSKPKPLVEFMNEPMLLGQMRSLVKVGVDEIVLAANVQPELLKNFLKEAEKILKIKISISLETVPLGTAGPLALARDILSTSETFFVLNSDVICDFPFMEMLNFHKKSKAEGTILVTKVDDPSRYGVVVHDKETGKIERFVEKPKVFVGDQINAGVYILNRQILDRIELKPTSIERQVFPEVAKDGKLFCFPLDGFWMDIGKPEDFIKGTELYLEYLAKIEQDEKKIITEKQDGDYEILPNVLIGNNVKIGRGSVIGPNVTIGDDCVIGEGVRIKDSVIMTGVSILKSAYVRKSIVGWKTRIGKWSKVVDSVLGEAIKISDETLIESCKICPYKGISEDSKDAIIL